MTRYPSPTVDVCINEVTSTIFCDEEGVDLAICQPTIPIKEDAKPRKQCPYVERKSMVVVEMARTMLVLSTLP